MNRMFKELRAAAIAAGAPTIQGSDELLTGVDWRSARMRADVEGGR